MYPSSSRELAVHAGLLAAVLWALVLADVASPGVSGRYSHLPKGNDFLQFYVSGTLAEQRQFEVLVDDSRFRAAQERFLGAHTETSYPAVYPPQVGLLFAPLTALRYTSAYYVWAIVSLFLVGAAILEFDRDARIVRGNPFVAGLLTLAFPPLAYLILAGQLSAIALLALAVVHRGLSRGSMVLAGAGIGLLAYKVSLFIPAIAVCLMAGEWTMTLAATAIAVAQTLCVVPIAGLDVIAASFQNMLSAARHPDVLVLRPYLTVSWRSFWALLLPPRSTLFLYAVTAGSTVVATAIAWRRLRDPLFRVGLLSLAIVLAAPHLFVYDLVVIVPAFMFACWRLWGGAGAPLRAVTITAFLVPLTLPAVAYLHFQWVTLVLCGFWLMLRLGQSSGGTCITDVSHVARINR
jgi:hypothetical protein